VLVTVIGNTVLNTVTYDTVLQHRILRARFSKFSKFFNMLVLHSGERAQLRYFKL
jgi:hypothetical protein